MAFKVVMLVPVSHIDTLKELADVIVEHPELAIRIISDEEFESMVRVAE